MERRKQKYYPEARRESYLRNKEKAQQYYQDNKERIRDYQKNRLKKLARTPEELEKYRKYHYNYYHTVTKVKRKEGLLWR